MKRKTQHFIFEGWNSLDTWTRMGVNCYNKRIGNGVEYDNDRMKAKVPILKKIKLRKKSNSNTSNTTNLKTLKITKDKSAKKTNRFTNKRNEMNEPNEQNEPNQPNGPNDLNALNRPNKESRTNRMGRVLKGSKLFKRKIKAKDLIPATDDMPLAEPIKVKKFPFGSRLTQSEALSEPRSLRMNLPMTDRWGLFMQKIGLYYDYGLPQLRTLPLKSGNL